MKSDGASEIDRGVRVPVWERGGQDYITNLTNGFVLETGDYEVLETENEWNSRMCLSNTNCHWKRVVLP